MLSFKQYLLIQFGVLTRRFIRAARFQWMSSAALVADRFQCCCLCVRARRGRYLHRPEPFILIQHWLTVHWRDQRLSRLSPLAKLSLRQGGSPCWGYELSLLASLLATSSPPLKSQIRV